MRVAVVVLALALAGAAGLDGFERRPGRRAIETAQALGRTPIDAKRQRFHAPYRIMVGAPPVDYIEIVTPYRRVVLAAEKAARAGDGWDSARPSRRWATSLPAWTWWSS
jgi:hypothetical protein